MAIETNRNVQEIQTSIQEWLQNYNLDCVTLGDTSDANCLLRDCLQIMCEMCDPAETDNWKASEMRLKAAHFVAMITWELAGNNNFLTHSLTSKNYETLVKTTVAMAFYDNNSYYSGSLETEQRLRISWLWEAMTLVRENRTALEASQKTNPVALLQSNTSLLSERMSYLHGLTAPFIEAVLDRTFNWYPTDEGGRVHMEEDDDETEVGVYQRSLAAPTTQYTNTRALNKSSILQMTHNENKELRFEQKMQFYKEMAKHMPCESSVEIMENETTKTIVDLSTLSG